MKQETVLVGGAILAIGAYLYLSSAPAKPEPPTAGGGGLFGFSLPGIDFSGIGSLFSGFSTVFSSLGEVTSGLSLGMSDMITNLLEGQKTEFDNMIEGYKSSIDDITSNIFDIANVPREFLEDANETLSKVTEDILPLAAAKTRLTAVGALTGLPFGPYGAAAGAIGAHALFSTGEVAGGATYETFGDPIMRLPVIGEALYNIGAFFNTLFGSGKEFPEYSVLMSDGSLPSPPVITQIIPGAIAQGTMVNLGSSQIIPTPTPSRPSSPSIGGGSSSRQWAPKAIQGFSSKEPAFYGSKIYKTPTPVWMK